MIILQVKVSAMELDVLRSPDFLYFSVCRLESDASMCSLVSRHVFAPRCGIFVLCSRNIAVTTTIKMSTPNSESPPTVIIIGSHT